MRKIEKLFLIGNGFDVQHNLHYVNENGQLITTNLSDFAKELKRSDRDLYNKISETLFYCLKCQYKNEIEEISRGERNKDWLWNHMENLDYKYDFDGCEEARFNDRLKKWVDNLNKNSRHAFFRVRPNKKIVSRITEFDKLKKEVFTEGSYFINFNYTNVLEDLYHIKKEHMIHLHGDVSCPDLSDNSEEPYGHKYTGPPTRINKSKTIYGYRISMEKLLNDWKLDKKPFDIYIYGFAFNGRDIEYLYEVIKKWTESSKTNEINIFVSSFQVKDMMPINGNHSNKVSCLKRLIPNNVDFSERLGTAVNIKKYNGFIVDTFYVS